MLKKQNTFTKPSAPNQEIRHVSYVIDHKIAIFDAEFIKDH